MLEQRPYLFLLSLLILGCGGDPAPQPQIGPTDPFGYYFLDAEKPQPAWTGNIDHLHLSTIDMKRDEMVTVPLYGFIRPKSGDDYRLVDPVIDGSHLTFTTQEAGGVSFDFDGHFLASGNFPEAPPQGIVLKGRLRQKQDGQVSGEMDAEFLYTQGD